MKLFALLLGVFFFVHAFPQAGRRPNVVLIITDDQGYGDFGWTGNPNVRTPNLDRLAKESFRFTRFYVSPVCAPTRASLMTGRYSLRTGVHDTYNGGALMAPEEITLAEMLRDAGYRTGIFGKWHLGDNYPGRPMDQGFDESLVHLSGGMGQVGDVTTFFEGDSSYFNPVLWRNGKTAAYQGYCSDVFANEAISFIEKNRAQPFFCYLAFNAPHTPLQVPENYFAPYRDIDPTASISPDLLPPNLSPKDVADARRVYAMVSNIDDNIGRLLDKLKALKLEKETVVIFMTDNGPQQKRYVAGMRGTKGSVYEGGIRVPMTIRYPGRFGKGGEVNHVAAHLDIMPTLAELCQATLPGDRKIDGNSLLPLLKNKTLTDDRALFFYWSRKLPERYRNVAVRRGEYKLVGQGDYNTPVFELYNIALDPGEKNNLAGKYPEVTRKLKQDLDGHLEELSFSPNMLNPVHVVIGTDQENPVLLNRNDAAGERGIWDQDEVFGYWLVKILPGNYRVKFDFLHDLPAGGRVVMETGTIAHQFTVTGRNVRTVEMDNLPLPAIKGPLVPYYEVGSKMIFPFSVQLEKIN